MKTFVIDPDTDRERKATVERLESALGQRYRVTLEEGEVRRTFDVDAADLGGGTLNLLLDGRSIDVGLDNPKPNTWAAWVGGRSFTLDVLDERTMRMRSVTGASGAAGGPNLDAPMAGKIIEVAVEVGQTLEEGDSVLIIEAMKMENDIKAHRGGVVRQVMVAVGDTVDVGATLLVIEGPAAET